MRTQLITLVLLLLAVPVLAQYETDRVYTGNQISNTVSVIAPATNELLGEIILGVPSPNVLTPLYTGQSLVHGLGYSPKDKILAVVSIGSNAVSLVDTNTNKLIKTIYLGRAPHEATFRPNSTQFWVTVRGEDYISVVDLKKQKEIKQIKVAAGPGMVAFTPDGKTAYTCSSFTPQLDIINTSNYKVIKTIPVASPFCPNIFASPDGRLIAFTHKDIGKTSVLDTNTNEVIKIVDTGKITNHVAFAKPGEKLLMLVTVGGENAVKVFDAGNDYKLMATIPVGVLPHGGWVSPDGKKMYIGLEYADQVQALDLELLKLTNSISIGQSPQALLYAPHAVDKPQDKNNLASLAQALPTQVITLINVMSTSSAAGQLSVRAIGQIDLVEQSFLHLKPLTTYVLALAKSAKKPQADYLLNTFTTNEAGKYAGQSTGLIKSRQAAKKPYQKVILVQQDNDQIIMESEISN